MKVLRALDVATDQIGLALLLIYAAITVAALAAVVVLSLATGTWWGLAALALPAFWLLVWSDR
jgi:hypothetical protein